MVDSLQLLIDAADDQLVLPVGSSHTVTSTLTIDRRMTVVGNGAVLVQRAPLDGPMLLLSGADGSTVGGLRFSGSETEASYIAADDTGMSLRAALRVHGSDDVTLDGITVSGKSIGAILSQSHHARIDHMRVDGLATPSTPKVNWHPAVLVDGSDYVRASRIAARNIGTVLTAGSGVNHLSVDSCDGLATYDNGVYISSGSRCLVSGCNLAGARGTGVKVRGSHHRVTGNVMEGFGVGVGMTGNGGPDDEDCNGRGNAATDNTIVNVNHDGVHLGGHHGYFSRDSMAVGNVIDGVALGGDPGNAGVRVLGGLRHRVYGNTVLNNQGDRDVILAGTGHLTSPE